MDYRPLSEVRKQILEESGPSPKAKGQWKRKHGSVGGGDGGGPSPNNRSPSHASSLATTSAASESDDPTALVREIPGAENITAMKAALEHEEKIQEYLDAKQLSKDERLKYIMSNGSTGQKIAIFKNLPDTLDAVDDALMTKMVLILVDSMWVHDPELQCMAPASLMDVLHMMSATTVRSLFQACESMLSVKTAEIRVAWGALFVAMVDHIDTAQLEKEVIPFAFKKSAHAENQDQREMSCAMLGRLCAHIRQDTVDSKVLSRIMALCQDTNVGVRRSMCQQLGVVARSLGVEMAKARVAPELFELLNDEEQCVSAAAFSCLLDLVEFFGPEYRKERLYAIIKSFISSPPDEVVILLIGDFGRFLCEIKEDIQTNEDVLLFANFYRDVARRPDKLARQKCVFNFPAVVASLPRSVYASHLGPCCEAFAVDACSGVRRSLAAGLHELVPLLGETAATQLQRPFLSLMSDENMQVRRIFFEKSDILLDCFRDQLAEADRVALFRDVASRLIKLAGEATRNWHNMRYVIHVFTRYNLCFEEARLQDTVLPVLLKYFKTGASILKEPCVQLVLRILARISSAGTKVQLLNAINKDFAKGMSYQQRIVYISFVAQASEMFSRRFIRERLISSYIQLQRDPVELVRMWVARVLPRLRKAFASPAPATCDEEYAALVQRLQVDTSAFVRSEITKSLELIEQAEKLLKRHPRRREQLEKEDQQLEKEEQAVLELAKESDKAERRFKLRDLLKSEKDTFDGRKGVTATTVKRGARPGSLAPQSQPMLPDISQKRRSNDPLPPVRR